MSLYVFIGSFYGSFWSDFHLNTYRLTITRRQSTYRTVWSRTGQPRPTFEHGSHLHFGERLVWVSEGEYLGGYEPAATRRSRRMASFSVWFLLQLSGFFRWNSASLQRIANGLCNHHKRMLPADWKPSIRKLTLSFHIFVMGANVSDSWLCVFTWQTWRPVWHEIYLQVLFCSKSCLWCSTPTLNFTRP